MARPIVGPASIKRLGLNSLATGLFLASASSLLDLICASSFLHILIDLCLEAMWHRKRYC